MQRKLLLTNKNYHVSPQLFDPNRIVLNSPFNAHNHGRQDEITKAIYLYTMRQYAGALNMSNTNPPITTKEILEWYREQIFAEIDRQNMEFLPLFVYYLSPELSVEDLLEAWNEGLIAGVKYYPKGGTTGSAKGLEGFSGMTHILEPMEKHGIPLLIHGELPMYDGEVVDDFLREQYFMEKEMTGLRRTFTDIPVVLEHISTKSAIDFLDNYPEIRATVTPMHCLFDTRVLFNATTFDESGKMHYSLALNGMRPDYMCRPIIKQAYNLKAVQTALIQQANGERPQQIGLGDDNAVHSPEKKYCSCSACGVFSAPISLEMYAIAFERMGILEHLPTFACDIMPEFYGIKDKLPKREVILERKKQLVAPSYGGYVPPFAGQEIPWSVSYN